MYENGSIAIGPVCGALGGVAADASCASKNLTSRGASGTVNDIG